VPISPTQPLKILEVARFWVRELKGTPQEESVNDLAVSMASAALIGELKVSDTLSRCVIQREREEIENGTHQGSALFAVYITRDEFLSWIDKKGYKPRPTFWPAREPPEADPPALISTKDGLTVRDIARFWARELKGTVHETSEDRLLYELAGAVQFGILSPDPDEWPPHLEEALEDLKQNPDSEDPLIYGIVVSRDDFFRWIDAQEIVPRPTFWGGKGEKRAYLTVVGSNDNPIPSPSAGSGTPSLVHRKRGQKRSVKSIEAECRLEAAVNRDPALLARLNTLSEKELAKICGCHPEKERHHIRTARDYVLNKHATK
jgi:hypothetical protein